MAPTSSGPSITRIAFLDAHGKTVYDRLPPPPGPAGFGNGFAAWAPDGRRIAAVSQPGGGIASIWIVEPDGPAVYREGWYVEPNARRKGVGRALITAAEAWARSQGCVELASNTEKLAEYLIERPPLGSPGFGSLMSFLVVIWKTRRTGGPSTPGYEKSGFTYYPVNLQQQASIVFFASGQ